ncbi:MAG: hypothetical protein U5K43_00795 [Halofilum sp. (in: g-proteobacteria)]|nr:hypothetical protein [Halofilum sp. (in: g-proteobacteria)]
MGAGALEAERSVRLAEEVDPGTREALETAEAADGRGVDELNRLTDEMARRWRPEDYGRDLLDEPTQRLEQARAAAQQLGERVGELSRALAVIDRPYAASEEFRERVGAARLRARQVLSSVETALGRYELIEMDIAHGDMRAKQARCEDEARRVRELDEQIALVRDKLRRQGGMARRLLRPRVARQQREQLLQRLQGLMDKRDAAESFVSEKDLLHWLDVLVEASLYVAQEDWQSRAQQTRLLLYRLLNVYCLQQETAAQQLAESPMLRANARDAIGYYLSSEQFILRYFSRKRQEVTLWLSGAASDKLSQLEDIRDAILADYRRNARG